MRGRFLSSLGMILAGAGLALAQADPGAPPAELPQAVSAPRKPRDLTSFIVTHFFNRSPAPAQGAPAAVPASPPEKGAQLAPFDENAESAVVQEAPLVAAQPPPVPAPPAPPTTPASPLPVLPTPTPLPTDALLPGNAGPEVGPEYGVPCYMDSAGRYWTSIDYLIWFSQPGPLKYPLFSSGALKGGALTVAYFDTNDLNYDNYRGARLTTGYWFDAMETLGIEGTGFFVNSPGITVFASSTQTTVPPEPLALPYIDAVTQTPAALFISQISSTNGANGAISLTSDSHFWGVESNLISTMKRTEFFRCELLGGFRYLDLEENFERTGRTQGITNTALTFLGTTLDTSNSLIISDRFYARNQFAGVQVGSRMECRLESLVLTISGKLAVGATHQVVAINGFTSLVGPGATTVPGGIFAQASNIGTTSKDELTIIPQFAFTFGYQMGKHCRVYGGYDCMFWNDVVRPGNQIDPFVNTTQAAWSTTFANGPVPTQPRPLLDQSDFFIHGINLGLEIRY